MKKVILAFLFLFALSPLHGREPEGLSFAPLRFSPPKIERRVLQSGATVYLLPDTELPLIQMTILIKTGSMYDSVDRVGVASLCSTLLRVGGTKNRSAEEIDEALERIGASIEFGIETEQASASLSILKKDLDLGIQLLSEMLKTPRFDKRKIQIEKAKVMGAIYRRNDQPFPIAQREMRKLIYGPSHPLSRTMEIPMIQKISRKDLVAFHKKYYRPNNLRIAVSGDFKTEEILTKLEGILNGWENSPIQYPEVSTVNPEENKTRTVCLAEKSLTQATILLSQLGIKRHNPDRFALEVLNEILGGSAFTSRLYKEVRSRRGLAYWIGSAFSEPWDFGTIGIGCQTKNASVGEVIETIQNMVEEFIQTPVPNEELEAAKEAMINSFVFRYSSSHAIVTQKMSLDYFGYPEDYLETYTDKISNITSKDLREAAKKYLRPKQMKIMIVGNPKEFDVSLERWGEVNKIDLKIDE